MRKLYILSGAPASGKTGFIRQHGLEPYTLSADLFRQLYANPVRRPDGTEMISQEVSSHAWKKLYEAFECAWLSERQPSWTQHTSHLAAWSLTRP